MSRSAFRLVLTGAAVAVLAITVPRLQAQLTFDDFNDGNDTTGVAWTHLTGYVGSSGQTWTFPGTFPGGSAYRLQAPNNGLSGLGFVGSYAPTIYSDATTIADFISFGGPGANPVFGVGARLNGVNTTGGLTGYAYAYEPFAAGTLGEMVLYRINTGVSLIDLGSQQVSLDPSKDYRFVLDIFGSQLHGTVYEINGGLVAERFATDATYASGFSGVFGYSQNPIAPTDFTVDNFAVVPEPGVSALLGLGVIGWLAGRWVQRKQR